MDTYLNQIRRIAGIALNIQLALSRIAHRIASYGLPSDFQAFPDFPGMLQDLEQALEEIERSVLDLDENWDKTVFSHIDKILSLDPDTE